MKVFNLLYKITPNFNPCPRSPFDNIDYSMLKKNFFFPLNISRMMGFSYLNSLCSHTFQYNVIIPPTQHSFSHTSRNDILFCVISTTNSNIELKETDLQGNLFNTCLYLFAIIIVIYNITGTC